MSGYVPGFLVPYQKNPNLWVNDGGETSAVTINGIACRVPNAAVQNPNFDPTKPLSYPSNQWFISTGNVGGGWWIPGDVTNVHGVNYTTSDSNNSYRDEISNAYISLFGRFPGGFSVENYLYLWLYNVGGRYLNGVGPFNSIIDMIAYGGQQSGETTLVATNPYDISFTYYNPQIGCTDSSNASINAKTPALGYSSPITYNTSGPITIVYGLPTYPSTYNITPVYTAVPSACKYVSVTDFLVNGSTSATLSSGQTAVFTWKTSKADQIIILDNSGNLIYVNNSVNNGIDISGSFNYNFTTSASVGTILKYTIYVASFGSGGNDAASVNITIPSPPPLPPPPPSVSGKFTLNNQTVTQTTSGNNLTFSWTITGQTNQVTVRNYNNAIIPGSLFSGSYNFIIPTVLVPTTLTFTVTATGPGGTTSSPFNLLVLPAYSLFIKDSDNWKQVKTIYINQNGTWKRCVSGYLKINGQWKKFI